MSSVTATAQSRIADSIWVERHIDPKLLSVEPQLLSTRWPDYQFSSPLAATQLFADAYSDGLKAAVRRHHDVDRAEAVQSYDLRKEDVGSVLLSRFWSARQKADALGAEYRTYINFSFDFATRRVRRAFPQPNQLGPAPNNPGQSHAWNLEWEKHLVERLASYYLRPVAMPQYHIGNFAGLMPQRKFRAKIIEQASIGTISNERLYKICVTQRCVPIRSFAPIFGRGRLIRRIGIMRDLPGFDLSEGGTTPSLQQGDLWQSCFALPHAQDDASSICQQCSQADACRKLCGFVEASVVKLEGTADPIGERKRRMGRERTEKSRKLARARVVAAAIAAA